MRVICTDKTHWQEITIDKIYEVINDAIDEDKYGNCCYWIIKDFSNHYLKLETKR